MLTSLLAVSIGASLGAILRWFLGLALNAAFPLIPLGTLAANLIGGYGAGIAIGATGHLPASGPERLLIMTGFLGSLTTFSAFSGEVVLLLQQQRLLPAAATVALHVCGSLTMTILGLETFAFVRNLFR
ncbi:MAG: fluoride efflux transporter CrcB [Desulfovibrio sp.]|jgi:CrcB protein|nr:fluoride efflux transporter CrcB [Desulfovibrio sp.]